MSGHDEETMQRSHTTRGLFVAAIALALMATTSPAAAQGDAKKGEQVYNAQKCQVCHAIAGKGNKANPLDGVGKKLSADDTRMWIVEPVQMAAKVGSQKKPPMPKRYDKLPAADLDALVAYMQSLK
jgi:mono/diheme cytochrome c family protein